MDILKLKARLNTKLKELSKISFMLIAKKFSITRFSSIHTGPKSIQTSSIHKFKWREYKKRRHKFLVQRIGKENFPAPRYKILTYQVQYLIRQSNMHNKTKATLLPLFVI